MKIENIKKVNVTIFLPTPLNHLLISEKDLIGLFKTEDPQMDQHTFIEAPGIKALIFPKRKKDIVFETNRILLNDTSGDRPESSTIIDYLQKILEKEVVTKKQVAIYGFNYDLVVLLEEGESFDVTDFIGAKISSVSGDIKNIGVNIKFLKDDIKYIFKLDQLNENGQRFLVHFNAELRKELPAFKEIKSEMTNQFKEFGKNIKKIWPQINF